MNLHLNPIIEIRSGYALADLQYAVTPFTTCVGLLVLDDEFDVNCRQLLDELSVPCTGIAFINGFKLRRNRRLAAEMALSRQHGCRCRVFSYAEAGRLWLEKQVNTF